MVEGQGGVAVSTLGGDQWLQISSSFNTTNRTSVLPPPPLVTHLLQEANRPVGPLDVIVGPDPLAHRAVQVRHDLGELPPSSCSRALTNSGTVWKAGSCTIAARRQLAWWKSLGVSNSQ